MTRPDGTTPCYPWDPIVRRGHLAVALVRHGQTSWNRERRFLGHSPIGLDDTGRAQALAFAHAVPDVFSAVYSSPLLRATQTARYLADRPTLMPPLRELDHGALEGLLAHEALGRFPEFFQQWQQDPGRAEIPDGESLGACGARGLTGVMRIARANASPGVVAAVTHQMVIAAVCCAVTGERLTTWRRFRTPNASATILEWSGENWILVECGWTPESGAHSGGSSGGTV